ncbi:recombinase family protein [Qipengyuania aquimaris]|uniref:Recombinase family protein n=1 Tax=Qipengyuania aquimaris TaxID=255984 RepID=A0A9Q3XEC0_9SPHN|nr:recombinase family protein [Qipengyuania aquimaris]MBY6218725.1 recombinase family protein [Qipengyuania aquimaris]
MAKVYSYTRFSTPEQAAGDSFRRQTEAARKWAEARGLVLDVKLSFADDGVSAYRGGNVDTDRGLGAFLFACQQGLVERGSYLLVESLDRISRMSPRKAQRLLDDIVDSGITVVTLNDGQEYTAERLDSDPTALLISLMVSWRAHEESKTKGRRVAAAWAEKRDRVRRGEDKLLTRRAPAWLEWSGEDWQPIEQHADTVRRVFRMAREGMGEHATAKALNEEGVPVMGRGKAWHRSTVAKLLRNSAVIGQLTPGHIEFDENGKKRRVAEKPIAGAYPAVVSEEDWLAVRALKDGAASAPRGRSAASPLQNLFAGLARCPDCGAAMTRVYKGRKGGKPKLVCTMAKVGKAKHYKSVPLEDAEEGFLRNWQGLFADVPAGDGDTEIDTQIQDIEGAIEAKHHHLDDLIAELERGPSPTLTKAARRIEEELRTLQEALQDAQEHRELSDGGMVAMRLDALREAVEPREGERDTARINAALRSLFDAVVIDYRCGQLRFQWKQGGEASLMYAWPEGA